MSSIRIEAENYQDAIDSTIGNNGGEYRFEDVDIQSSRDIDGGYSLGWIDSGEWLTYNFTVPTSGEYRLVSRMASARDGNHSFTATLAGQQTNFNVDNTGGWWNWQNVESAKTFSLDAGSHEMRLDMLGSVFNINYLELIPVSSINNNSSNLIHGGTGNNSFYGSNGIDTITYDAASSSIVADLGKGKVIHNSTNSSMQPFKIMPLGDSNTEGWGSWDLGAYRDDLWKLFDNSNYNIDFVGPHKTGPSGFDRDNAGFSGWKIGEIDSAVDGWLNDAQPDMVLLMIGTNDILRDDNITQAPSRLNNLIDNITYQLPDTQLLVASIPPISRTESQKQQAITFNSHLPGIIDSKAAQGKNVSFVDVYSGLTADDLQDGVHPTVEGYSKIADTWYDAILEQNIPQDSSQDTISNIENIIGSNYDDVIIGSAGANVIQGGAGNDTLTGGGSSDTFVLGLGEGIDTITDFAVGEDSLQLSDNLSFQDITIIYGSGNGYNDTTIIYQDEALAVLTGMEAGSLSGSDFV
ncbi:lysophospholipase L1-like esterase [Rivularia sp. PCC 7116]|uniref:GDSL-type esterase/lipase family protein n=1 Tax=Rivularia sp. PCC 7116 TaxID=373994 RepID=UPI00029EF846|nr:GDSL-type esterase/lipase family protein [Rivularia sp. PCC 7116]AFY56861.1 lysophospholipase L1-like esterase [Rivularia sp. PCC 7116]